MENLKNKIQENFVNYLKAEGIDADHLEIQTVCKNNKKLTAVTVYINGYTGAVPVLYLEEMYKTYISEGTEKCLEEWTKVFTKAFKECSINQSMIEEVHTGKKLEERLVFELINKEKNEELLNEVLHRDFLDLAIVYRYIVEIEETKDGGTAGCLVTERLAREWGVSEDDLYRIAYDNTRKLFPVKVNDIQSAISSMMFGYEDDEDDEITPETMMVVLSNSRTLKGAAVVLYEDLLHDLSEKLDNSFYLLPSSVHEFLALNGPCPAGGVREMAEMVRSINGNELAEEDVLSNSVYFYNRDTRKVEKIA